MKPEYILFDKNTEVIVYGNQERAIQRMLDFDYICRREKPSVVAIITPTRSGSHRFFFGSKEIIIPMYKTIKEAVEKFPDADVMVNFASYRSAYPTTVEALNTETIRTIGVIAEGVPERRAKELIALSKKENKYIIGPATVGGMAAGAFRIGNTAGTIENIVASKLTRPGSVGFVSKSGGMLNEMFNIIARNSNGIYEGIAIGGDRYPCSTLLEHILRYEKNPKIKMSVCLGEVGGLDEYEIVEALKNKKIKKPLVIWVTGTCAKIFPTEVQFGHAGARAGSRLETADAKNKALSKAGAIVPKSFNDFGKKIKATFEELKKEGKIQRMEEIKPKEIPMDFKEALKDGKIRKKANIICTITDDRGEEPLYAGIPISEIIKGNYSLGDVISLLWFKRKFPQWASDFIELVLKITADHGPCVSGAHNAIITARAGKDLMSCVASGLLTIGPRFGGAVVGAAKYFKQAYDTGMEPREFVDEMKNKGILIPGIGHRVKSLQNPDKRVELLKEYAFKNFPKTEYLNYALKVEKITTTKRNNLILNVDGCIGILSLDLFKSLEYTKDEIQDIIDTEVLNGLFVLGRTIGIIGHTIDQKRLKEGLYRHPWDDVSFMLPREKENPKE